MFEELTEFWAWFDGRREKNQYEVTPADLDRLDGWHFEAETGNLVHRSGRFFTVEGVEVSTGPDARSWSQPIIVQPEVGVLGILVKRFAGEPYCLMQAKMEPGNVNLLQLSPTVQATRSNYTRVHRGNAVPYLEHFLAPGRGRTVFDSLQSEQGSWFLAKRNRNMIVEVPEDEEVPVLDDFCWLSPAQLGSLLRHGNLVNMDSRTVLSGMPFLGGAAAGHHGDQDTGAPHSTAEILGWLTAARSNRVLERRRIPLNQVKGWSVGPREITHEHGAFFSVRGVDVRASSREVAQWSQPLLAPAGQGVIGFLGRRVGDEWHLLVHARSEAGSFDVAEMSATVNCLPENYTWLLGRQPPPFLDDLLSAPPERVHLDVLLSEEGGRFDRAVNRYLLVEAPDGFPSETPEGYLWMTRRQLTGFVRYGNHVDVAARSLLACLAD